ncbi:SgcJ/EcaC family oxidoreductase [Dyadobacter frigoris]|uniref:SgcJ/EcaC family oxidoreductase n=1 Tax=Dyadobacter frigoris TaxID=2576211 RepID=A0A4U6DBT9_9BACT|nr:SgcJ/EcaC family oxidoreductase [Dyadobacter frigoris]TKT94255.1 SgcJ/EcaC family oxidoreductase [Dyadobacter frigoris]
MKSVIYLHFLLFVALVSNAQNSSKTTADKAGIDSLIVSFSKAFNAHDPKAFTANFTRDADFTNWLGISEHGWAEIEESHIPVLTVMYKNAQQKITSSSVRFIRPDVAAVDIRAEVSGGVARDGKVLPLMNFLLNWTVTKESNGKWLITVMHNTRILPIEAYAPGPK